jgi:hypothetical protein
MPFRFNPITGQLDLVNSTSVSPSGVNKMSVTINFGPATDPEEDTVYTTVSAPWVAADSVITLTLGGPTSDHDLEDAAIERIIMSVGNIVPGVSFDIIANAGNCSWGQYQVEVVGV